MTNFRVVVGGDTTLSLVKQGLQVLQPNWQVSESGFNSWLLDALNPTSSLYSQPPNIFVVILSPRFLQDDDEASDKLDRFLARVVEFPKETRVILSTVAVDPCIPQRFTEIRKLRARAQELNARLETMVRDNPRFELFDLESFIAEHGIAHLHDARYETLARMYFSPRGAKVLSEAIERHVSASLKTPKKVLVVDLDNTLWGGVLGEDGPEGIKVGGEGIGHAFLRFQRALVSLKENGFLLAICSKNNESDALAVLGEHPDMILRSKDFVAHRINWLPKAENIKSIAEELGLGLNSFVFFDDSAFEREQVSSVLPEVDILPVPSDAANYLQTLANYRGFDTHRVTDEDRLRLQMYQQESQRRELQKESGSIEDFYRSLKMKAVLGRVSEGTFARTFQLVHKTNQFNLTVKRYTEDDLRELVSGPDSSVYTLRLSDQLGESGLTGVVAVRQHCEDWEIENLLLSCRIIGRTVEYALVRWIADQASRAGAKRLIGRFVPSKRNQVAANFLSNAGFEHEVTSDRWVLNLAERRQMIPADFVDIEER